MPQENTGAQHISNGSTVPRILPVLLQDICPTRGSADAVERFQESKEGQGTNLDLEA